MKFSYSSCLLSIYKGSPILTIEKLKTLESRKKRLENLGFEQSAVVPIRNLKTKFSKLEPFDEYETLHYYQNQYYIGYGSKNVELSLFLENLIQVPVLDHVRTKWRVEVINEKCGQSFSGFSKIGPLNFALGGFGFSEENENHRKLSELMIIDENGDTEVLDSFESLYSPICHILGSHLLLFGGRTSPNKVGCQ